MPYRQCSQSDHESSVSPSSGESQAEGRRREFSERSKKASASRRAIRRHERYSSGYGSFDESADSAQHSSRRSSTRSHKTETPRVTSPPSKYFDEIQAPEYVRMPSEDQAYYSDFQNDSFDERESNWSGGSQQFCSTVVEVPEEVEVSHLRSSGRDRLRHAPDMILRNARRSHRDTPLQVQVDNEPTEYELLNLVNDNEAIDMLKMHTKGKLLLRTDAVKNCEIHGSDVAAVFRYQLMTLVEEREVFEKTKSYTGKPLKQGCETQSAWDYQVDIPKRIRDSSQSFVLPNTERLKSCKNCNETGKAKCKPCDGMGSKTCERCHGDGHESMTHGKRCFQCSGGFQTCDVCHGLGRARCDKCEGKGRVVAYKVLKVTWKAKKSMYMDEVDGVPKKHLLGKRGRKVFSECGDRLNPISEEVILHETVRQYSRRQLNNHSCVNGEIVQQKHIVDVIPIQSFDCCYKNKDPFRFYVIGLEKKIFVPYFPKKRLSFIANLLSR